MKRIIILLSLIFSIFTASYTQLFEDGVNIYAVAQTGFFAGPELFNNQGTIAPSFYNSFSSNTGTSFMHTLRIAPLFSMGYKINIISSDSWKSDMYKNFEDARSQLFSLHPMLLFHNRFSKSGIFNRVKLFGSIAPLLGWTHVNIRNHSFIIINPVSSEYIGIFKTNAFIYGAEASARLEYSLNNQWGVFANIMVQQHFVNIPFFIDNHALFIAAGIGLKYNISKQKRFNY